MADVLLFHSELGLTPGTDAFADLLRDAGHTVTAPDLYDGQVFGTLEAGLEYAGEIGLETIEALGVRIAEQLPEDLVYIGFSLGVLPAQRLAQTRPGARGAVLVSSCVPPGAYAYTWPAGVPLQIHAMADDPVFVEEGDLDAARNLVDSIAGDADWAAADTLNDASVKLILYPGSSHFFVDISSPDYDEDYAHALTFSVLELLAGINDGMDG
ncbi:MULTISPECIES: dienelactone hydrolase family protein [Arthrobacter]|uniref:dienelactone hydrolase family protein n=1 Tax=Arthrobacter TaxID=1663 RepID=UPI00082B4430|nr:MULTISPECIES: dienelactone hydrolase family protein [Arthrobacter]UPO76432.1 dienelactone hydrolase family protein [Arthrobacter sp. Helios]